jgi:flagellar motor component MotA
MEIAMEGILCIQSGDNIPHIVIKLAALADIKNNPLDAACVKYLAGDYEALDHIDLKTAIRQEEEREEVRFIRRVLKLTDVTRREGKLGLEKRLDFEAITARHILEYGLSLIIEDWDYERIDEILTMLINHEINPVRKNIALAKKDAVRMIYEGYNPRMTLVILLAYFDENINEEFLGGG